MLFVYNFVITNFGILDGTIPTSHLFLQKSRLSSLSNIFLNEAMATKNTSSQASTKNTVSLTRSFCQVGTALSKWLHGVGMRGRAKAIATCQSNDNAFTQTLRLATKSVSLDVWSPKSLKVLNSSLCSRRSLQ